MVKSKLIKKKPSPVNSMSNLEHQGFISELKEFRSITGKSIWKFRMGKLTFHYNKQRLDVNFSKYLLRIVYSPKKRPPKNIQVWIENFELPKDTKHIYPNGSLCLFKPENFRWMKWMTIEEHLFSTICTWLYHHEVWKETGKWHGEEARH